MKENSNINLTFLTEGISRITIKDNTTIPLLNKFPERFDLPGIYQKEIIFKDNLGKNE